MPAILHEPNQSINDQLTSLLDLENGWNGADSKAPNPDNIENIRKILAQYWLPDMPLPFVFPMENGGVNLEWFIGHAEHGLEIDFVTKTYLWEWWDTQSQEEYVESFDFDSPEIWDKIQQSSTGYRLKEINYSFGGPI